MALRTRLGTTGLALLVPLLSCALVVSTPTTAQALDWKDLTKVEKLTLHGPTVQTGKSIGKFALGATPPGRLWKILSLGALAWGAYEGADYLLNARQPGGSAADWLGETAAYPTVMNDGVMKATVVSVSGRTITGSLECANGWAHVSGEQSWEIFKCPGANVSSGGDFAVSTNQATIKEASCRNTTTNVVTLRTLTLHWNRAAYIVAGQASGPVTRTTVACNTGEVLEGFRVGPTTGPNPSNSVWTQTAGIGWGTLAGSTLPEGELEFQHAVIEAKCRNAETDEVQTIRTVSEWGASETLVIPSCKQRLGDEWYGIGVKVIPMDPEIDDVPLDPEIWPDWDVPDFMPEEWTEGEVTPEEEADPCTGSKDGCPVTIEIDGEPVFPGTTTRTKIDTLRKQDPDRVKCYIGQRAVEWKVCIPLLPGFEPGAGQSTTIDPTKPVPDTGVPPTTGTGTQPVPTEALNCIKANWSWNPVDFVFVPVMCALKIAFIPNPATWGWEAFVAQVMARPPTSIAVGLVAQMQAVADGFQSGGTCGVLADFGDGMAITCPDIRAIPGFLGLYAIVQVALVGLTGFTVFHIFRTALGSEGS